MKNIFDDFAKKLKKKHAARVDTFETGTILDWLNGEYDPATKKISRGFSLSKFILLVGKAGSGKTTLAIHMASKIMRDADTQAFHFDIENGTSDIKLERMVGSEKIDDYYKLNKDISIESIYEIISEIKKMKENNKTDVTIKSPWEEGVDIITPTPIVIDSLITLKPRKIMDDDELSTNMANSQTARLLNKFYEESLNQVFSARITPIVINHIRDNISTGITPPTGVTKFLKNTETIPGGKGQIQFSDIILKLEARNKLELEKDFDIKGFVSRVTIVKSRRNASGRSIDIVFDQYSSFDNELTTFLLLKDNNLLLGSGRGYYVEGSDFKFTKKNFKEKYLTDELFRKDIDRAMAYVKVKLAYPKDDIDIDEVVKINFPELF